MAIPSILRLVLVAGRPRNLSIRIIIERNYVAAGEACRGQSTTTFPRSNVTPSDQRYFIFFRSEGIGYFVARNWFEIKFLPKMPLFFLRWIVKIYTYLWVFRKKKCKKCNILGIASSLDNRIKILNKNYRIKILHGTIIFTIYLF